MANQKVRFVLLGCGGMMGGHAQRLCSHPEAEIVGLCDVSLERVAEFTGRHCAAMLPPRALPMPLPCIPSCIRMPC